MTKSIDRERLTITLRGDLLDKLDGVIDGVRIRNRSHAIEYLLSQSLAPKVTQAVILAGGQGVKMRPLTYEVPKPLIPVAGKPLIGHTIEMLEKAGIREVIVAIGHLGNKIKQEIGNGKQYGVTITYSEENKPLGSAGALANASSLIEQKPFVVVNGDVLMDIDLSELISFHNEERYVASMALTTASDTKGYGTAQLRGERIRTFIKEDKKKVTHLVNAGVYVMNPQVFDYFPKKGVSELEDSFEKLAQEGKLAGFPFEGKWYEVSTPQNYEKAIKAWKK